MPPTQTDTVSIRTEQDVVVARQHARRLALEAGFGIVDQTKIVTAASELARNVVVYGQGGVMRSEIVADGRRQGLRLAFVDEGPGIPDLKLALTDGWTSGKGLGLGLSGAKRLMHDFEIETFPGQGTRVTVTRWK
ncbi:MAG TPA: anti-sigma regulatory factor [Vicinamibacterales bacterium]|jgi:serine/threonine-protein kinase RsbT|nr:anti-sigma regulatory factor [Vicinamibacterales bacterium]